ncbi:PTS sugar transporter subunit IIB [Clostridium gelidum]|uniref:PTS sugar transporter subunit IIB n=1 Tax=Clostridium gelidum TaxID=704125 RepID=A0ABN6IVZ4_9CLOT|nr:PTS sugar transporter subunit IIB [Clostridium gelidum]BCZ46219.1 PTS sugar transporter subunit IIB [Clostridium gelidum]
MVRIGLFCASGMSTSILVNKIKAIAEKKNIEIDINAFPESEMVKVLDQIDVALLGPQVRFFLDKAKQICEPKNIKVSVINMKDYGMMDGEKILDTALELFEK